MPQPTASDVHVSAPLTNMSIRMMQNSNFVADKVFPNVEVKHQSNKYFTYPFASWNRTDVQVRAPGTESPGSGWTLSTDTYFCDGFALHKDIDDPVRENQDDPLDIDTEAVEFLVAHMQLKREKLWASTYFTTGLWTGSTTGTDITPSIKWNASSSVPIKDIRTQIRSMHSKTGQIANTLVLAGDVWDALQDNADFLDRIKYTQTGIVTTALLAQVLEIDRVIIANALEVTSPEGAATDTITKLFTDDALLLHVAPSAKLRTPSAGYTFSWNGRRGMRNGMRIKKFRMENLDSDRVEIDAYWDQKQVSPLLGVYFDDCLT